MTRSNYIAAYLFDPNPKGEPLYLLLRRSNSTFLPGIWQVVTGKVDEGERADQAVFREVQEETGLILSQCYSVDVTTFYDRGKDCVAFSANFCAQVSQESVVTLSAREHAEFKWCTLEEACDHLAFPAQKETLMLIHKHYVTQIPDPVNLITACR